MCVEGFWSGNELGIVLGRPFNGGLCALFQRHAAPKWTPSIGVQYLFLMIHRLPRFVSCSTIRSPTLAAGVYQISCFAKYGEDGGGRRVLHRWGSFFRRGKWHCSQLGRRREPSDGDKTERSGDEIPK